MFLGECGRSKAFGQAGFGDAVRWIKYLINNYEYVLGRTLCVIDALDASAYPPLSFPSSSASSATFTCIYSSEDGFHEQGPGAYVDMNTSRILFLSRVACLRNEISQSLRDLGLQTDYALANEFLPRDELTEGMSSSPIHGSNTRYIWTRHNCAAVAAFATRVRIRAARNDRSSAYCCASVGVGRNGVIALGMRKATKEFAIEIEHRCRVGCEDGESQDLRLVVRVDLEVVIEDKGGLAARCARRLGGGDQRGLVYREPLDPSLRWAGTAEHLTASTHQRVLCKIVWEPVARPTTSRAEWLKFPSRALDGRRFEDGGFACAEPMNSVLGVGGAGAMLYIPSMNSGNLGRCQQASTNQHAFTTNLPSKANAEPVFSLQCTSFSQLLTDLCVGLSGFGIGSEGRPKLRRQPQRSTFNPRPVHKLRVKWAVDGEVFESWVCWFMRTRWNGFLCHANAIQVDIDPVKLLTTFSSLQAGQLYLGSQAFSGEYGGSKAFLANWIG
ncbi:hypothetical protein B0H16DRAFT_1690692 [Mycena metata]|uniref:Uncharacterized protein n=1 Tax=Mycena metata TaxID=1033252 RepID=A0AAD7IZD8_9AGAR|nr:hypothetical protein B0H16DRAFT_1690692 [Mycena metata]